MIARLPVRVIRLALFGSMVMTIGGGTRVSAHDCTLVVSRDASNPPRLFVNGPSNYLGDLDPIDLLPGDGPLAGCWFNDAPGFATIRADGDIRQRFRLLPGHRIALRLVAVDPGLHLDLPSTFQPLFSRPGDAHEFPLVDGGFSMQILSRSDRLGEFKATFQFVDLSEKHADSAPFSLRFRVHAELCLARATATMARSIGPARGLTRAAIAWHVLQVLPRSDRPAPSADGHGHSHLPAPVGPPPGNFRETVIEFRGRLHAADAAIAAGAHHLAAEQAALLSERLSRLAGFVAAPSSGVPCPAQTPVVHAATIAWAAAAALDRSARLSDAIAVREFDAILNGCLELFESFVPPVFACPMRCEGDVTYPAPGRCPDCGMKLADTRAHMDHRPRHGGTFFMAADNRHHLEGVLEGGEFRVYFYDEFTKPLPAGGFAARIEIAQADPDDPRRVNLCAAPSDEYLRASLGQIGGDRVQIKMFVDFKNGERPGVFDFEFPVRKP